MSFLFPAYLLGFLGLALPWILHRFSDQQAPERVFPSQDFLESTIPPVSRRKTLRYRTLLALRIAALMLLCALFAEPWINRSGVIESDQQHHIIAVDKSLSMQAVGRWDNALSQASEIMSQISTTEPVDMVVFDKAMQVIASSTSQSTAGPSQLLSALNQQSPGYSSADYGAMLQRLNTLAADKELPVKLWLISDLQRSALPAQLNALYAPNIASMDIFNVVSHTQSNVHLSATASSSDGVSAQVRASLIWSRSMLEGSDDAAADSVESLNVTGDASEAAAAGLSNSNESESQTSGSLSRTVQVSFDEEVVATRVVELVAGELSVVSFDSLQLPEQGNPSVTVSLLESDDLLQDNTQTLLLNQNEPTSITMLSADRSRNGSAAVFLTTAMETDALATVEVVQGSANLVATDTPHLVAGRTMVDALGMDILQYVDRGNNALVYNTADNAVDVVNTLQGSEVGVLDDSHPLALGEIDWFGARFYALPDIELTEQDRVLVETVNRQNDNRQVLLMERKTNRGRLLILNDPLNGLASNLPLQPAFVALMQSIIRYFDANTAIASSALVGERVALPPGVQVLDPEGDTLLGLGNNSTASSVSLDFPGLYTVVGLRGEQMIKVALDSDEANITAMSDTSLQAWLSRYDERYRDELSTSNATDSANGGQSSQSAGGVSSQLLDAGTDGFRQSLWFWLLPVALAAFVMEAWSANRRLDVRRDGS